MKIPDLDKWCLGNADCNWVAWRDADYHNPEDVKKFLNFIDIHSSTSESKTFAEYRYDKIAPRISEMGGWANFEYWLMKKSKKEAEFFESLKTGLEIAANQLEGVSLAITKFGTNINVPFWIKTYKDASDEARIIIKSIGALYENSSKEKDSNDSIRN